GTDGTSHPVGILLLHVKPGLVKSLFGSRHRVLAEQLHSLCCLEIHIILCHEIFHFRGNLGLIICCIESGDGAESQLCLLQAVPKLLHADSDGSYRSHTGHYYSSHTPVSSHSHMAMPPSTQITCPVIYPARSEARNATVSATSSTRPNFFSGICSVTVVFTCSGSTSVISVSINPGATAFTVIPLLASSLAMVFVRPITPALEAA